MGGHFLASYPAMGYRREAVAYFISRVIPTTSFAKISFQHHAFCLCKQLNTTIEVRIEKRQFRTMDRLCNLNNKSSYNSPLVETLNIVAERGYVGSLESPEYDGEL